MVEGLYILQVQLRDYDNPNQQCFSCTDQPFQQCSSECCDAGEGNCTSGERRCDTFFTFCLKPLGNTELGCDSSNSRSSMVESNVNQNDKAIDFSQGSFLGLYNPVNLSGLTNNWNVSRES